MHREEATSKSTVSPFFYGYWQHSNELFNVLFNDFSNPNFQTPELLDGNLGAVLASDKFQPVSWLTLRQMAATNSSQQITSEQAYWHSVQRSISRGQRTIPQY